LIDDLEEQVWDGKKIMQQLRTAKIQHETYLAFQDTVIKDLEAVGEEITAQDKIKEQSTFRFLYRI
jgi:hypothetical protein